MFAVVLGCAAAVLAAPTSHLERRADDCTTYKYQEQCVDEVRFVLSVIACVE
jgi:hypothetical protein